MLYRHKSLKYARFQTCVFLMCSLKWGFLPAHCQPQAFANQGGCSGITVCSNLVQRIHVASGINAITCLSCNCACTLSNPLPCNCMCNPLPTLTLTLHHPASSGSQLQTVASIFAHIFCTDCTLLQTSTIIIMVSPRTFCAHYHRQSCSHYSQSARQNMLHPLSDGDTICNVQSQCTHASHLA